MAITITEDYAEESIKTPALITLVVLILIAAPLVYWQHNINRDGEKLTDISSFDTLVTLVASNTRTVNAMLNNDMEALAAINASRKQPVVTLIVPEVVILDEEKPVKGAGVLNVKLQGVYWNPARPLVGINGETYGVGDVIQGYEITRVDQTSVQFQAADGTIVVKDMYENLLQEAKD
jgi:hypothetical protein